MVSDDDVKRMNGFECSALCRAVARPAIPPPSISVNQKAVDEDFISFILICCFFIRDQAHTTVTGSKNAATCITLVPACGQRHKGTRLEAGGVKSVESGA